MTRASVRRPEPQAPADTAVGQAIEPPRTPVPGWFRAVAVDFDGTLAEGGQPGADVLSSLSRARAAGVSVVLVTGRILSELRTAFPDVHAHVDAVVAENGAVLARSFGTRILAPPVDDALTQALSRRNVTWRSGRVLVACQARDEVTVLEELHRLGLDCHVLRNRSELMILPAGVTKGTGLLEALGDLGLSHHNTIGVGDAENDHSLLEVCEVGIAVANAIPALRERADVVLPEPDGRGVAALLDGDLIAGREHVYSRRWQIALGTDDAGDAVRLPASQLNILVAGGTGDGKSYLAGLIAEQLIGLGYSLLVVDPEGDHVGLEQQREVLVVGGEAHLLPASDVARLMRHRYASVVIDLSSLGRDEQTQYLLSLPAEVQAQRTTSGLPQWVIIDEAHTSLGRDGVALAAFEPSAKGHCLVTWRPEDLSADALAGIDAVIALSGERPAGALVDVTAAVADVSRAHVADLLARGQRRALLAWRRHPGMVLPFTPGDRLTPHRRHEHKYDLLGLPPARRFYFRRSDAELTDATAANLGQLEHELGRCDPDVLRHHCPGYDFSRWILHVFEDADLAQAVRGVEATVRPDSPAAVVESARVLLIAALQGRRRR